MSLKDEARNAGVKLGSKVAATIFGSMMDYFARKRPNGLVARFRKRFGRISPGDIAETTEDFTNRVIEKAKKKR